MELPEENPKWVKIRTVDKSKRGHFKRKSKIDVIGWLSNMAFE